MLLSLKLPTLFGRAPEPMLPPIPVERIRQSLAHLHLDEESAAAPVPSADEGGVSAVVAQREIGRIYRRLPSLRAIVIGDISTGRFLASHSESLPLAEQIRLAGAFCDGWRQTRRRLALVAPTTPAEEMLLTCGTDSHLFAPLADSPEQYLYVCFNNTETNLALVRATIREGVEA